MTQTLTTERMEEIAKLATRLHHISGCAAVTSSGETIMHHTFVDTILSALHDVTAELLANREAQPVAAGKFAGYGLYHPERDEFGSWLKATPQSDCSDAITKHGYVNVKLFTAPPAPAVVKLPTELYSDEGIVVRLEQVMAALALVGVKYERKRGACRAAMLTQPVSQCYKLPDGFKLMPIEMTDEIGEAIAMEARCCGGIALCIYEAALAAAPEGGNGA